MYYDGRGVDQNFQEAFRLYKKAAAQGEAGAQYALGGMYYLGQCAPKNFTEAANWFLKAAKQNHPEAQRALGWAYDKGQGVPKSRDEAIKWFTKAARMGHKGAINTLKKMGVTLEPEPALPKEEELVDLAPAAEEESEQKTQEATDLERLIQAAHRGDPESQYKLSRCYYRGIGAPQDMAEAQKWLEKAASKGYVEAQFSLGVMYYKDAVKWFQRAAENGSDKAQFSLGVMYLDGRGVQRDRSMAIHWFKESAKQGNHDAVKQLEKMKVT
jgi:hypothetical protein